MIHHGDTGQAASEKGNTGYDLFSAKKYVAQKKQSAENPNQKADFFVLPCKKLKEGE